MRTWDAPTLARFLDAERGTRYHVAFLFLATTGCRRGEALGLRWTDVDLDTGRASLRHTIGAIDHRIYEKSTPKSHRARVIDLDADTVNALRIWRTRQAEERLLLGPAYDDRGLVFCHPDGQPYHPDRFSREFDRRIARHGVPRIRLHDLRHTWATLALQAGIDVKVVSERLGHASATITWASTSTSHRQCSPTPPSASRVSSSGHSRADVPRLSFFYGIAIYLYFEDHPPPHIHARYAGHEAKVDITTGEVIEGSLPRTASRLVAEWVTEHSIELADCWAKAASGEQPGTIEPLQ